MEKTEEEVAIMIKYKQKLLKVIRQKRQCRNIEDHTSEEPYKGISILQKVETEIINMCQAKYFRKEIEAANAGNKHKYIHQLDPFLDRDAVLRVGRRLGKSNLTH